ncbi:MAG: hypothetical protein QXZ48_07815 [Zestosphaera sp.]
MGFVLGLFGFRLGVFGLVSSSVLRVASGLTVFSGLSAIFELLILWVWLGVRVVGCLNVCYVVLGVGIYLSVGPAMLV